MTIYLSAVAAVMATGLLAPTTFGQELPQDDAAAEVVRATVTGYATGADGGAVGSITATGVPAHWGTVAADWRLYPPGTRLKVEGFPNDVFTVEDRGGSVRGNVFDIWFPDLASAMAFGTKSLHVTILGDT